jgi:Baseplate J-like protein
MTLPLPNLDDRTYADLVEEARTLIRTYQPEWTNYNASDPGITLVELFAWLAEMLIYRADQVPDRHRLAFLQLLNGPGWLPSGEPIDDQIAATLTAVRSRYRAVTAEDYEALTLEASPDVVRALCVPRRDLNQPSEMERAQPRPGYVSVIVVPVEGVDAAPLCAEVHAYLERRRLLTTQNVVAEPVWTPVEPHVLVAPRSDVPPHQAAVSVTQALRRFLDPRVGGREGTGWPFGRDIYVSEIYRVLEALPEVDYVPDVALSSTCGAAAVRCVAADGLWNAEGDQIGLRLAPQALPRIDGAVVDGVLEGVFASGAFVVIRVTVMMKVAAQSSGEALRQAKIALRTFFEPALDPGRTKDWTAAGTDLRDVLQDRVTGATQIDVELSADPAHRTLTPGEIKLSAHELPDLQPSVQVVR